ncbi:MAG: prolipoprotein diacylglyceryl transferase [Candidatus Azobacteroides sp.]|nr:prolipoprotein diacylglyceryl transferase [Candidatus Azobacteroides sp.]
MLSYITWTADPAILSVFGREIRWYGLFFAIGFLIGYKMIEYMFKKEQVPPAWADKLFIYVIIATVIGSRLGHCLFYDFESYIRNPIEIFKIWKGGLASHGGTIGVIIGVWLYSRNVTKRSMLWTLDRLVVPTALVASLIRLGNLMNHEIYGYPTDVPWAFKFITNIHEYQTGAPPIFSEPSHPTQIYEASVYFLTFILLVYLYFKTGAKERSGLIFGIFLTLVFLSRFFIEFIKLDQEAFEEGMILNMGQLLSIPFIIAGIYFMCRGLTNKAGTATPPKTAPGSKKK